MTSSKDTMSDPLPDCHPVRLPKFNFLKTRMFTDRNWKISLQIVFHQWRLLVVAEFMKKFDTSNQKCTNYIGGSTLADARHMPPPRVQILSFWHTKFLKRNSPRESTPPYEVHAPLREILDPPLNYQRWLIRKSPY